MSAWLCAHIVRAHQLVLQCAPLCIVLPHKSAPCTSTPKGFEPLRAEPNGFLVHLLSHSDTVSVMVSQLWPVLCCCTDLHNARGSHALEVAMPDRLFPASKQPSHGQARCGYSSPNSPRVPWHATPRRLDLSAQHHSPLRKRHRRDSNPCGQSPMDF